jgi:hypothetical protein
MSQDSEQIRPSSKDTDEQFPPLENLIASVRKNLSDNGNMSGLAPIDTDTCLPGSNATDLMQLGTSDGNTMRSVVTGLNGSRFPAHPIVLDDEERETEGKSLQTFALLKN